MLIPYLGMLFVVLAGPPVGMLLARIAPDEREIGERWFVLFRYALIALLGALLLWAAQSPLEATLAAAGVLLFLAFRTMPLLEHALVGIAFWFSSLHPAFPIVVLLLFLLGMVGGTLAATPKALKQKRFWQIQRAAYLRTVWPVLIAVALYFI